MMAHATLRFRPSRGCLLLLGLFFGCGDSSPLGTDAGPQSLDAGAGAFDGGVEPTCELICTRYSECRRNRYETQLVEALGEVGQCLDDSFLSSCVIDCFTTVQRAVWRDGCDACFRASIDESCVLSADRCERACRRDDTPVPDFSASYLGAFSCWLGEGEAPDDRCFFTPGDKPRSSLRFSFNPEREEVSTTTVTAPVVNQRTVWFETPGGQISIVSRRDGFFGSLASGATLYGEIELRCPSWCELSLVLRDGADGPLVAAIWYNHPPPELPELELSYRPEPCRTISELCGLAIPLDLYVGTSSAAEPVVFESSEYGVVGDFEVHNGRSHHRFESLCDDEPDVTHSGVLWRR